MGYSVSVIFMLPQDIPGFREFQSNSTTSIMAKCIDFVI